MKRFVILLFAIILLTGCGGEEKTVDEDKKSYDEKQVYYELVELQDSISLEDPSYNERLKESYITIANRHGLTEKEVRDIGLKGSIELWPIP